MRQRLLGHAHAAVSDCADRPLEHRGVGDELAQRGIRRRQALRNSGRHGCHYVIGLVTQRVDRRGDERGVVLTFRRCRDQHDRALDRGEPVGCLGRELDAARPDQSNPRSPVAPRVFERLGGGHQCQRRVGDDVGEAAQPGQVDTGANCVGPRQDQFLHAAGHERAYRGVPQSAEQPRQGPQAGPERGYAPRWKVGHIGPERQPRHAGGLSRCGGTPAVRIDDDEIGLGRVHRGAQVVDLERCSARERVERDAQGGARVGCCPVVESDVLDTAVDRRGVEAQPGCGRGSVAQRVDLHVVAAAGQCGGQCTDREEVSQRG